MTLSSQGCPGFAAPSLPGRAVAAEIGAQHGPESAAGWEDGVSIGTRHAGVHRLFNALGTGSVTRG